MIDHLMTFADEATARADPVVGKYWTPPSDDNPAGSWRGDVTIPGVEVYTLSGYQTITNPDGSTYQSPIKVNDPGWFIVIALPALDPNLEAEAGCVLIADRDMASAGKPGFLLYTA